MKQRVRVIHKHIIKTKEMFRGHHQTHQSPRTQFLKHGVKSQICAPIQAQARMPVNARVPIVDPVGKEPNSIFGGSAQPDHSVNYLLGTSITKDGRNDSPQNGIGQQNTTYPRSHFLQTSKPLRLPISLRPGTYLLSPLTQTPVESYWAQQSLSFREHRKSHPAGMYGPRALWSAVNQSTDAVQHFATLDHRGYLHLQTLAKYSQHPSQTHTSEYFVEQQLPVNGDGENGSITDRVGSVQQISKIYGDSRLAYADIGDGYYFRKLRSDHIDQRSAVDKPHAAAHLPLSSFQRHTANPNTTFDSMVTRDGWRKTAANEGADHQVPESRHPYPSVRVPSLMKGKMKNVANEILSCLSYKMTEKV